jgi:hypothetical protein
VVRDEINLALSYRPEGDIFWKDEVRSWKYEKIKGERWESTKYYEPSIGTGSGKR